MRRMLMLLLLSGWASAQGQAPGAGSAPDPQAEAAAAPATGGVDAGGADAEVAGADAETAEPGVKAMLGMSILGNEETPKSLVIVPWKSSQIGDGLGVSNSADGRPAPVDRDVFLREVRFYELRAGSTQ